KTRVGVIEYKGRGGAHEVKALRGGGTWVREVGKPGGRAVVRLESPGGVVHGYGLAASQLQRLRDKNIPLTVTGDKVAASGGYMMGCVAEKINAAPFAYVGSSVVLPQIPDFTRFSTSKKLRTKLDTTGKHK
ncbi:S49 family peptidase, partial [Salmonella enterica]|uniref:S49 family peptidase n=1 Tax=Salmonella enterica TaxID=28901 RepID=UPI00398C495E